MTIAEIKNDNLLLFECISGSKAYGLNTPQSDTDLKGVFILSKNDYFGLQSIEQINNATNDEVYYEVGRYVELLLKNNPNIIEMLATESESVLTIHPILNKLKIEMFLSKLCFDTFAGYAQSQIKKAKGLNKKIVNPIPKEKKTILDFCFVPIGQGSMSLIEWLNTNQFLQQDCGLVNIPHIKDAYAIFHKSQLSGNHLSGLISSENSNDLSLSSVEKGVLPLAWISFNKDGYSKYCKDYKDYWEWTTKRNQTRFENTQEHGKNYDAKNMMHTFRLLNMAEEIAIYNRVMVKRRDRDFLLQIKSGFFDYDQLVQMADQKISEIERCFLRSTLPSTPDYDAAEKVLISIREYFYG